MAEKRWMIDGIIPPAGSSIGSSVYFLEGKFLKRRVGGRFVCVYCLPGKVFVILLLDGACCCFQFFVEFAYLHGKKGNFLAEGKTLSTVFDCPKCAATDLYLLVWQKQP